MRPTIAPIINTSSTAWINYHHLFYFKVIAEEGSISKASVRLKLGQPTLSSQLKQLEENLGVKLFERQHKKLSLTEHGKIAFDYAQNIFKLGAELLEALEDRLRPTKPTLHVASLDSIPKQVVSKIVKSALRIAPCQITLSEGKQEYLLRELINHKIDLLISNYLPSGLDAKGILHKKVVSRKVSLFGSPSFLPLKKGFPTSLRDAPVILPTYDSKLRLDLDHWAKLHQVQWNILIESQDIAVKKHLATQGVGLIAAGTHATQFQTKNKDLIEIGVLDGVYEELYIMKAQRKIENPIAKQIYQKFNSL